MLQPSIIASFSEARMGNGDRTENPPQTRLNSASASDVDSVQVPSAALTQKPVMSAVKATLPTAE